VPNRLRRGPTRGRRRRTADSSSVQRQRDSALHSQAVPLCSASATLRSTAKRSLCAAPARLCAPQPSGPSVQRQRDSALHSQAAPLCSASATLRSTAKRSLCAAPARLCAPQPSGPLCAAPARLCAPQPSCPSVQRRMCVGAPPLCSSSVQLPRPDGKRTLGRSSAQWAPIPMVPQRRSDAGTKMDRLECGVGYGTNSKE
jgi:hypothetical protein